MKRIRPEKGRLRRKQNRRIKEEAEREGNEKCQGKSMRGEKYNRGKV